MTALMSVGNAILISNSVLRGNRSNMTTVLSVAEWTFQQWNGYCYFCFTETKDDIEILAVCEVRCAVLWLTYPARCRFITTFARHVTLAVN